MILNFKIKQKIDYYFKMLKIFLSQKTPDKTFSRWYDFLEVMTAQTLQAQIQ